MDIRSFQARGLTIKSPSKLQQVRTGVHVCISNIPQLSLDFSAKNGLQHEVYDVKSANTTAVNTQGKEDVSYSLKGDSSGGLLFSRRGSANIQGIVAVLKAMNCGDAFSKTKSYR